MSEWLRSLTRIIVQLNNRWLSNAVSARRFKSCLHCLTFFASLHPSVSFASLVQSLRTLRSYINETSSSIIISPIIGMPLISAFQCTIYSCHLYLIKGFENSLIQHNPSILVLYVLYQQNGDKSVKDG